MYPLNQMEKVETNIIGKYEYAYPFKQMKPGDWFFVPFSEHKPDNVRKSASSSGKRLGARFSVKRIVPGCIVTRVW